MLPSPLDGVVTRPDSFDPTKDYAGVLAVETPGWVADFDLNDLGDITRAQLAMLGGLLLRDGTIVRESGGSIATPVPSLGNAAPDVLGAAGTYVGMDSQIYQVAITVGGAAGTARYSVRSTGSDNPIAPGADFPITAIAPDLSTALGNLAQYGHSCGTLGVVLLFVSPFLFVTAANAWAVPVTYGAQPPTVSGTVLTTADVLVYVQGRPHRARGVALTYGAASSGISLAYAEWTRALVSYVGDATLRDTRSQTPTCWRWQWRVVLTNVDNSAAALPTGVVDRRVFPVYQWDRATNLVTQVNPFCYAIDLARTQGGLTADRLLNVDQSVLLQGLLARRDFNAHGSYVAAPLPPRSRVLLSTNAPDAGKIKLSLAPITASVDGLDVILKTPTEIQVDQATDTAHVTAEPHVYTAGTDPFTLNKPIAGFPAKQVTQLTAQVAFTETVTRGGTSTDTLTHAPVVSVSSVDKGGTHYTVTTDYTIVGNGVVWVSGHGPTGGQSYTVTGIYQKVMILNTDYAFTSGNGQVTFATLAGDDPVASSTFNVDYDYYLARIDAIVLRPTGDVAVVRGLPAEVPLDPVIPVRTLAYAKVAVAPNNGTPIVGKYPNDAISMERLNDALQRLDDLIRDAAALNLTNQARARAMGLAGGGAASANLIDVFTDDFATLLYVDLTYNAGGTVTDCTVDAEALELTLPFLQTIAPLTHTAAPGGDTDVALGGAFVSLPWAHELAIQSANWSFPYPVNPYADVTPESPVFRLTPGRDQWVDTTTLNTSKTRTVQNGQHEGNRIVKRLTEVTTRTTDIPLLFMRQIAVSLVGLHFVPGEKVRLKFDHKDVAFTADAPSTQGGDANTVIARVSDSTHSFGDVYGHFTIPANVPCGTVFVELWGDQGLGGSWPGGFVQRATAAFTGLGTQHQIAVQTLTILVRNDPIAQSLLFPTPRMISKVDVPMAAKPANKSAPLILELRDTDRSGDASTPIATIDARAVLEAADVAVGPSSTNPVAFADPVYMFPNEFRALVLRSASRGYQAYVAEVGGPNRATGGFIQTQQITPGIFMDSADNTDWTLRQGWDLRCSVYVAKMSALTATSYYARVTSTDITAIYLSVDQVVPDGTAIAWQYSVDGIALGGGGKVWVPFQPFTVTELPAIAAQVDIRAILTSSDAYVTPSIHRFTPALLVQSNKTAGTYVSQALAVRAGVTGVNGGFKALTPGAASAPVVTVSLDGGTTWSSAASLTAVGTTADGWTNYVFTKGSLTAPAAPLLRVKIAQATSDKAQRPRVGGLYAYPA